MKYVKMLGLAAVAAAALMAFVGASTASATQLTGEGGAVLPAGTNIHASAEQNVILHPPIGSISCSISTVEGDVDNAGGPTSTVSGAIDKLTFESCNATVHVLNPGSLEVHAAGSDNGTLKSKGARVTVVYLGFHCIFETSANGTTIGTLTGSANTGGNATLDIAATIPRVGGNSGAFCGSSAQWTGAYAVSDPAVLNVH